MQKLKLTPQLLKKIIAEERLKLESLGLINENESSVERKLKVLEKLTIEESKVRKKLQLINETKRKIKKSIVGKIRK